MHDEGGLSKFACLVLVASAQMEDAGDWTCVISFRTSDGFKSISKSVSIKIKDSYCYDYPGELFKWPANCSQQPPDAISIDIGGQLTKATFLIVSKCWRSASWMWLHHLKSSFLILGSLSGMEEMKLPSRSSM